MAGPPDLNDAIPAAGPALLDMLGVDQADAASDHDRFVIAAVAPVCNLFIGAENAGDVGPSEFIAERGAADGPLRHDLQRRRQSGGELGVVPFPRQRIVREVQVRSEEGAQPGLRVAADAGGPLVADLATHTGRCPGER